jgi:hypothetical protein
MYMNGYVSDRRRCNRCNTKWFIGFNARLTALPTTLREGFPAQGGVGIIMLVLVVVMRGGSLLARHKFGQRRPD